MEGMNLPALLIQDPDDIEDVILQQRRRFVVPVKQGLVLISQIQRCGGTLISQLLDGHSQLHVHPGELHIGRPRKYDWPAVNLGLPAAELFDQLFERPLREYTQLGFQKVSHAEAAVDPAYRDRVLPFILHLRLQRQIFADLVENHPPRCQRDAIDHYITSYFNAWLDYQGLYRQPAQVKYWATFGARLLTEPGNMDRFISDYPDGKAIAVLRHPVSWFASARRHSTEYEDVEEAAALWRESFEVVLRNVTKYPEVTLLIALEDCLADPERTMNVLARFLEIGYERCLLTPTFNGMAIQSDSSFGSTFGLDRSPLDRSSHVAVQIREQIMAVTGDLFAELKDVAETHRRRYGARQ
jgi:hypothetical protein